MTSETLSSRPISPFLKALDIGFNFALVAAEAVAIGTTYIVGIGGPIIGIGTAIVAPIAAITGKVSGMHAAECFVLGAFVAEQSVGLISEANDHVRKIPERIRAWHKTPLTVMP